VTQIAADTPLPGNGTLLMLGSPEQRRLFTQAFERRA
jgi:hypothetical protein